MEILHFIGKDPPFPGFRFCLQWWAFGRSCARWDWEYWKNSWTSFSCLFSQLPTFSWCLSFCRCNLWVLCWSLRLTFIFSPYGFLSLRKPTYQAVAFPIETTISWTILSSPTMLRLNAALWHGRCSQVDDRLIFWTHFPEVGFPSRDGQALTSPYFCSVP